MMSGVTGTKKSPGFADIQWGIRSPRFIELGSAFARLSANHRVAEKMESRLCVGCDGEMGANAQTKNANQRATPPPTSPYSPFPRDMRKKPCCMWPCVCLVAVEQSLGPVVVAAPALAAVVLRLAFVPFSPGAAHVSLPPSRRWRHPRPHRPLRLRSPLPPQ